MENQLKLAGRTVLISGASGGLGAHFARRCSEAGAAVVLGARRRELLERVAADVRSRGGRSLAVGLDVTDEYSVKAAFDAANEKFGTVDGVIANAGIERSGRATELTVEDFDTVYAVNVRGAFLVAREAARRLRDIGRTKEGRIVMISSITGSICVPGLMPYSVSKAAVSHMTRMLAREWARHGPNVNALAPGYMPSDLNAEWFESELGQQQLADFPRQRLASYAMLDDPLIYLLSDASEQVTGSIFTLDDGQTL